MTRDKHVWLRLGALYGDKTSFNCDDCGCRRAVQYHERYCLALVTIERKYCLACGIKLGYKGAPSLEVVR